MTHPRYFAAAAVLLATFAGRAGAADDAAFNAQLLSIQQAWARVNYETPAGEWSGRVVEYGREHLADPARPAAAPPCSTRAPGAKS